jgi:guanine deaminase
VEADPKTQFMRHAIKLSAERMREGAGGPFGAVIVKDGKIIAEGWNRVTSTNDPTAHAEVTAIRDACKALGTFSLAGCEIYTSCEPCPMCLSAIYWARLDRIYFANSRDRLRRRVLVSRSPKAGRGAVDPDGQARVA